MHRMQHLLRWLSKQLGRFETPRRIQQATSPPRERRIDPSGAGADFLVMTQSCYAAVYDEASPVNVADFAENLWLTARQAVKEQKLEPHLALFAFNQELMGRSARGELLPWLLLFDGVFRTVIKHAKPDQQLAPPTLAPTGMQELADVECSSGRLIVACLSQIGEASEVALTVSPGKYRLSITFDQSEVNKHEFLENLNAYPAGDGPDWLLTLQKI